MLRVTAVCLNHRDLKVLSGEYSPRRTPERTPCSDGVGEVIAVGEGVTAVKVGDRATCGHFVTWLGGDFSPAAFALDVGVSVDGWLAEQVKVPRPWPVARQLRGAIHDLFGKPPNFPPSGATTDQLNGR